MEAALSQTGSVQADSCLHFNGRKESHDLIQVEGGCEQKASFCESATEGEMAVGDTVDLVSRAVVYTASRICDVYRDVIALSLTSLLT